jgi:hypothetical protein
MVSRKGLRDMLLGLDLPDSGERSRQGNGTLETYRNGKRFVGACKSSCVPFPPGRVLVFGTVL